MDTAIDRPFRPWLLMVGAAVLSAVAGCTDLGAIRDFAKSSATVANYTPVLNDYAPSIERQKRYLPDDAWLKDDAADQAQYQADKKWRDEKIAELTATTAEAEAELPRIETLHKTVVAYMTALGQLADDDLVSFDKQITGLTGALKDSKVIDADTAKAVAGVASLVARAFTDRWRQAELAKLIKDTDSDFQIVVKGLQKIVSRGISGTLGDEAAAANSYFEKVVLRARSGKGEIAGIALVQEIRRDHAAAIAEKQRAADAYVKALGKIAAGHADLKANAGKLSDKQLLARISADAKDIQTLYENIKALSK